MSRRFLRRPHRLSRPVVVAIAAVVGLGGLGGGAGALLGELGSAGAAINHDEGRHHDDRFDGLNRFGGDGDGNGATGAGPLR